MLPSRTHYEAGRDEIQLYAVRLDLVRAGLNEVKADIKARFIEFWSQSNCLGSWRVEQTTREIIVSFALSRDMILFKMSTEYGDHENAWGRTLETV